MSTPQYQYQPQHSSPYQQQPGYGGGVQLPQGTQPGQPMGFAEAVKDFFRKYVQFSGRASRSQYWWPALALFALSMVVMALIIIILIASTAGASTGSDTAAGVGAGGAVVAMLLYSLLALVGLATFLPTLAASVRRLHDTDRSGWWYFISFVPMVGGFILLYFLVLEPNPRGARFDA